MKKILLTLLILIVCKCSFGQSYSYDKNLKVSSTVLKEIEYLETYDVFTVDEIVSEFESNSIRANNKFKNKMFILKGEVASIQKINGYNFIGFNISDNRFIKQILYVLIYDTSKFSKIHNFDKITNYSVGNWVTILALTGETKTERLSLSGNILHGGNIANPKKNHLVKINNIPEGLVLSYEHDNNRWAQKFSPVVEGKSYCKFFNNSEKTSLKVSFIDSEGVKVKEVKIVAKINCISTFDYNKL